MTGGGDTKISIHLSEMKLKEEKRRLALLQESLTRSDTLTTGMVSTLENFERKLKSIDELVTPVYEATDEQNSLLSNVDQSLVLVDSILHYYEICNELQSTVSSGPGGNLTEYLAELDRLQDAVKYFKRTNSGNERERVVSLFDLGIQRLVEETDRLILRYSNPLLPKDLIDLCEVSETNRNHMPAMQEVDMSALRMIIEWFISHGYRQGLIDSYATKRGAMIRRSLQLLAEHFGKQLMRRGSTNVITQIPSVQQNMNTSTSDLSKRSTKKISDMGRRFMRHTSSDVVVRSGHVVLPATFSLIEDNMIFDSSDNRDANNYKRSLDAFIFLLQSDRDLLNYVFPKDLQSSVYTKLIEYPLLNMQEEAQKLCESVEKLPHKIDTGKLAVYGIFSILQRFLESRVTFTKLYQDSDANRRQQFTNLSATFEHSAATCFRAILEEVNMDSTQLSQGGNVHPLTSHVLAFMEGLQPYEDIATITASLYVAQEQSSSGGLSGAEKGLYDLGMYFVRLIRSLYANLSNKVDNYSGRTDTAIRSIFLLNNINYLLKRLEKSHFLALIQRYQPNFTEKFEADFQNTLNDYTKCFSPLIIPIHQMLEYDNNNRLSDTKLRDRDREVLKESFSSVNAAIDAIRQQSEQYIVSDADLRNRLRNEGRKVILDLYKRYYDKFASKDFTKNREKYIRYEPRDLESVIDKSFGNHS